MKNLFTPATGMRMAVLLLFVACVYLGCFLYAKLAQASIKPIWKVIFVIVYAFLLLLVSYMVWFVLLFGLNT